MNPAVKWMLSRVNGLYENWLGKQTSGWELPEEVEEFRNIPYGTDGKTSHRMDLYRPKCFSGKLPVVLNLHGGGLVLCTKEVNRPFCGELAKRGCLVICMDYPLVPEKTVPEILEDVSRGMDRAGELLAEYGGDPDRVILTGDSAGAFLAVYALAIQKDEVIARAACVRPSRVKIRGLGLLSGMFYTAEADETGFFLRKDFYGRNWRQHPLRPYLRPEKSAVASLMEPCFLVTGKSDRLRGQTLRFCRGLEQNGISHRLLDFPRGINLGHDFGIMSPKQLESRRILDEMVGFFFPEKTTIDKTENLY